MRAAPADKARLAAAIALAVLGALLAWPLRKGHAYLDDYVFLALGRHLEAPWPLLFQDSLGAFFFRPVTMFVWWATVALLGTEAPGHLAFNVALHAANGYLLFALLRRLEVRPSAATLAALCFVAHPATFSSAAWLSDRFDLLATFFGLVALLATERALHSPGGLRIAIAAGALTLSILAKETGYAVPLVAAAMVAWKLEGTHASSGRERARLLLSLGAAAVAMLALRPFVLRAVGDVMFLNEGIAPTLWKGTLKWLQYLPDFLVVRQGNLASVAAWCALLLAIVAIAFLPGTLAQWRRPGPGRIAVLGALLALSSAAAQSPVFLASPIFPYAFDGKVLFEPLAASRFFYLPLVGLAMILAAVAEACARAYPQRRVGLAMMGVLATCALVGLAASSRAIARDWAIYPLVHGETMLRAAADALARLPRLQPGCKVYFLATPARFSAVLGMLDTGIKRHLPRGHAALGCFLQAEHAPWYHLLEARGLPPHAEKPMETILFGGKPFEAHRVGNLEFHYLRIAGDAAVIADPRASFLAWRGAGFEDVTGDVRERRLEARFFDNRPPY
ncbi:MAG TPA: hypothetical protein VEC19_13605 [Usitatibacter sp.]|nr:hypothetical protein [Usitatibacter sp.]